MTEEDDIMFEKATPATQLGSKTMKMEKKQNQESIPVPACPGCGMIKNEWPGEGYTHDGETYCCQGCAEGTGCTCVAVGKPGFSRQDRN